MTKHQVNRIVEENQFHSEQETKKGQSAQKMLVAGVILLLIILFYQFDLAQYFSLEYIKASQERFALAYQNHPWLVIAAYMGIYIVMAALSLPGAAVLTLLGGALFGMVTGTIAVSFASTVGATLACAVARFILRDWVQHKIGEKLEVIHTGIEQEGAWYLLTMRLIPMFPFWLVNLALGLTRMPISTFYWVSQLGMLPGTVIYVFAGRQLGQIDSLSGILSPGVVAAFVLLGLFPIMVKKVVAWYQVRRPSHKTRTISGDSDDNI